MITTLLSTFAAAASQAECVAQQKSTFLGLKTWYAYLTVKWDGLTCHISNFDKNNVLGAQSPFLLITLAILDDLVRVAALVAVGFVIYGGIQYVISQGSPDATNRAKNTIINALIGLVLAVVAAGLISFIGNKLGNIR